MIFIIAYEEKNMDGDLAFNIPTIAEATPLYDYNTKIAAAGVKTHYSIELDKARYVTKSKDDPSNSH